MLLVFLKSQVFPILPSAVMIRVELFNSIHAYFSIEIIQKTARPRLNCIYRFENVSVKLYHRAFSYMSSNSEDISRMRPHEFLATSRNIHIYSPCTQRTRMKINRYFSFLPLVFLKSQILPSTVMTRVVELFNFIRGYFFHIQRPEN